MAKVSSANQQPSPFLDRAIASAEQDRLGHQRLAEQIVASVEVLEAEGIVVGIQGPWGSGKSGLLNLVSEQSKALTQPPTIVRFNPWWFSGRENLYSRFFGQFVSQLRVANPGKALNPLLEKIEKLGNALSTTGKYIPVPVAKEVLEALGDAAKLAGSLKQKEPSLDELRRQIIDALDKHKKPIWVFIDDLDRLEGSEMLQMLALVRSLADFPWVSYLVAFDPNQVGRQILKEGYPDAQSYLEKILDLSLSIPVPEPTELFRVFQETIGAALGNPVDESWDGWFGQHHALLPTVRRIRRLGHAVKVAHALHQREVHEQDLVGLELLRLVAPAAHAKLARHDEVLREEPLLRANQIKEQQARKDVLLESLVADAEQRQAVRELIISLFPQLDPTIQRFHSPPSARRISQESTFRLYFRLGQRPVPTALVEEILGSLETRPDFLRDSLSRQGGEHGGQAVDPLSLLLVLTEEMIWRYQNGADLSENQAVNLLRAVGHGADGDLPPFDAAPLVSGSIHPAVARVNLALAPTGALAFAKSRDEAYFEALLEAATTLASPIWAYNLLNTITLDLSRIVDSGDPENQKIKDRLQKTEAALQRLETRTVRAVQDRLMRGEGLPYPPFFIFPLLRRAKTRTTYTELLNSVRGTEAQRLARHLASIVREGDPRPEVRDWIEPLAVGAWLKHQGVDNPQVEKMLEALEKPAKTS